MTNHVLPDEPEWMQAGIESGRQFTSFFSGFASQFPNLLHSKDRIEDQRLLYQLASEAMTRTRLDILTQTIQEHSETPEGEQDA